jgi:Tfp pilus assembly protein PilV
LTAADTTKGSTLIEALFTMVILSTMGVSLYVFQTSSWKNTAISNKSLIAGHMIENQIECMRIAIDRSPTDFFPPISSKTSGNGINLTWTISPATRPTDGTNLANVRKCSLVASWGKGMNDSLKVTTYLSKMF